MSEGVALTGVSCISCFGVGHAPFIEAIRAGRSGIAPVTRFDTSECHSHSAATIRDFDPASFIPPLKLRRIDAVGRSVLVGTRLALEDAGCIPGPGGRDDVGIALGTSTAGLDSLVEYLVGLTDHGPSGVPAILFSNTISNAPASLSAIEFGLRGPNVTFNQREASSLAALAFSVGAVRHGRATAMITGGADVVEETLFKVFDRFRALSPMAGQTHDVEGAHPYDRARNGYVLGEGAFLVLIESASAAAARGAHVYGEILGIGATSSPAALNAWPADGRGLAKAMRLALADGGLRPDEIAAVIGTGNGSPVLDRLEADAIADVFSAYGVQVTSIKGAIGECGAGGAASLIAGALSLADGIVTPTVGLRQPDEALALQVSAATEPARGTAFLVNSTASGGTQYSIALRVTAP